MRSLNWKRVDNPKDLPKKGGHVYACVNDDGVITYIGQSTRLYQRACKHKNSGLQEPHYLYAACPKSELNQTEMELIKEHKPKNNIRGLVPDGTYRTTTKLSPCDVRNIREDSRHKTELAEIYGVTPCNIAHIKAHRSWRHIK